MSPRACCLGIFPAHPPAPWGARLSETPQRFLLPLPGAALRRAQRSQCPRTTPAAPASRCCACPRAHGLCRPGGVTGTEHKQGSPPRAVPPLKPLYESPRVHSHHERDSGPARQCSQEASRTQSTQTVETHGSLWVPCFIHHRVEKEMATHSSVLSWRIPRTGESGRLQSVGSLRIGHNRATEQRAHPAHCPPHCAPLGLRLGRGSLQNLPSLHTQEPQLQIGSRLLSLPSLPALLAPATKVQPARDRLLFLGSFVLLGWEGSHHLAGKRLGKETTPRCLRCSLGVCV